MMGVFGLENRLANYLLHILTLLWASQLCGIVGFIGKEDKQLLRRMNTSIFHRGPDQNGFFFDNNVNLAMRRLSIIDLSTGKQPIHNEAEDVWIVFNGEIYNYRELYCELEKRGHRFYTKSDTEAIVHAYEEWGIDSPKKLNGMFAFAIWDQEKKLLFLARDRLGEKPLHYALHDGVFYFASEIKALLQEEELPREIDRRAVSDYFSLQYIPVPETIFKGVKKLPPGHSLVYQNGKVSVRSYWDVSFEKKTDLDEATLESKLLALLKESVEMRLMSDVPLGAFLSGGVDSSTVVGLMSKVMDRPVKTFSVGFEEEKYSELKYARQVAELFETDHRERVVKYEDLPAYLPDLVWHYDEPFADSSALPTYCVAEFARKHVTVCLSGDGGDEGFGGYSRTKFVKIGECLRPIPKSMKNIGAAALEALPHPFLKKGAKFLRSTAYTAEEQYLRMVSYFSPEEKQVLLGKGEHSSYIKLISKSVKGKKWSGLDRVFYIDMKTYLPDDILVKVDRATMANSLEARVPFLDHRVLELTAKFRDSLKLRGLTTKYFLKKVMRGLLPREILHRNKMGFGAPIAPWFRDSKFSEVLLEKVEAPNPLVNQDYVDKLLRLHKTGTHDNSYKIWAILMFKLWYKAFIEEGVTTKKACLKAVSI